MDFRVFTQEQIAVFAGILIVAFFVLLSLYYKVFLPFKKDRDYIKMEIQRSSEVDRIYWKRKLKIFYLRHIPFFGRFFHE